MSYGNFSPWIFICIGLANMLLCHFFLYNVSGEFDLKAYRNKEESVQDRRKKTEGISTTKKTFLNVFNGILGLDAVLLLLQQFYTSINQSILFGIIPAVIADNVGDSHVGATLVFLSVSVTLMINSFIIQRLNLSNVGIFNSGVLSLIILLFNYAIILLLRMGFNDTVNYSLIFVYAVFYSYAWVADQTYIVATLGKMFSSSDQAFIESIRVIVWTGGSICGYFFSMFVYLNFIFVFPVLVLATVLLLIGMYVRRDTLCNPEIVYTALNYNSSVDDT